MDRDSGRGERTIDLKPKKPVNIILYKGYIIMFLGQGERIMRNEAVNK